MNDSSYIPVDGGVCAPQGFLGSAVSCGIKKPTATRLDLALIYSTEPCVSAGTFTTNRVQAACVKVSREHLRKGNIRAIVANSGNANACTGTRGVEDARGECRSVAELLGLEPAEVAVCSTGVIGLPMPMMRIYPKIPELAEGLSRDKGHEVAQAVMTSDTKEKIIAIEFVVQGKPVRIGACCKGAGMINPCMATMLCFITTDAGVSRDVLELCVQSGVKSSFNCITIDGDMSTNDTVLVMANGASGVKLETPEDIYAFQQALAHVMLELAKHIVQDGERVTKFVTVHVTGGRTEDEAKKAAEEKAKAEAEAKEKGAKSSDSSSSDSSSNRSSSSGSSSSSSSSGSSSGGGLKTVPPASGSSGSDIAAYACQFVGNPYVAGGTSLTNGADCSGFIWAVYRQYGYGLPRNSAAMRSAGREVSYEAAQAGDIVCYAGHVALYLGGGRIVHASTARTGIKYGYANYKPILTIRRIVG